jgi:hypothetical protein
LITLHALKQSALAEPPHTEYPPAVTGHVAGRRQHVPVTLALHDCDATTPRSQKNPFGQLRLMLLQLTAVSFGHDAFDDVMFTPSWAARLAFQ